MSKIKSCADSDIDKPPSCEQSRSALHLLSRTSNTTFARTRHTRITALSRSLNLKILITTITRYTDGGMSLRLLKCKSCGERSPFKNNTGVVEELVRIPATSNRCQHHLAPARFARIFFIGQDTSLTAVFFSICRVFPNHFQRQRRFYHCPIKALRVPRNTFH